MVHSYLPVLSHKQAIAWLCVSQEHIPNKPELDHLGQIQPTQIE